MKELHTHTHSLSLSVSLSLGPVSNFDVDYANKRTAIPSVCHYQAVDKCIYCIPLLNVVRETNLVGPSASISELISPKWFERVKMRHHHS